MLNKKTNAPTNNLTEKIVSISGNRWPSVTIYYNGFYKDISIDQEGKAHAKRSSNIILKVKKGALGYFIIESKELEK